MTEEIVRGDGRDTQGWQKRYSVKGTFKGGRRDIQEWQKRYSGVIEEIQV